LGGVWITSTASTVSDNKIAVSGGSGIFAGNNVNRADNAVITGNKITAAASGINVTGADPDVEKNTVTSIAFAAPAFSIACAATCSALKVVSNTATGNNGIGIFVHIGADATGGQLSKNTSNGNSSGGFYINGGESYYGGLTISGNTANNNGGALYSYVS